MAKLVHKDAKPVPAQKPKRELLGVVVSDKMDKTVVVEVKRQSKHGRYHKYIRSSSRYKVHDQKEESGVGDLVSIVESRPLSRTKRFAVRKILRKAKTLGSIRAEEI